MTISTQTWVQYGKMMMTISGLACIAFALNTSIEPINVVLRIWVGLFGAMSMYVSFVNRTPPEESERETSHG